jgi:hypothetical protein
VVSAGERDPDAEGAEGMSASKMRAAAAAGEFEAFKSGTPNPDMAQSMYDAVRNGMGIKDQEPVPEANAVNKRSMSGDTQSFRYTTTGGRLPTSNTSKPNDITKRFKQVDMPDEPYEFDFDSLDTAKLKKTVARLIDGLGNDKNKQVVQAYFGIGKFEKSYTLDQIATAMGVTREAIRQRLAKVLRQLRHPDLRAFMDDVPIEEVDLDEMAKKVLGEPGAYIIKQGKTEYKISPRLNRNDRPSGEWQIFMKDRDDWEWDRTVGSKRDAIDWIKTQKEDIEEADGMMESLDRIIQVTGTLRRLNEVKPLNENVKNKLKSVLEAWSEKYKRSINCNNPKGFSQRAHCAGRKKNEGVGHKDLLATPKNTVVIDTPGELDWYKIGQHFPTLDKMDPREFGQSETDMVITFATDQEKEVFLKLAKRLGLKTMDIGGTGIHPEIHSEGKSPQQDINEALDSPYPIRWEGDADSASAVAEIPLPNGDFDYLEVSFDREDQGFFEIVFRRNSRTKATGKGDEFRIFATVIEAIKQWWSKVDQDEVDEIYFSASKDPEDSTRRHVLYSRFAKQFADQIGFDLEVLDRIGNVRFVLKRKDVAEGKSPHKKGTKKYKAHMAAMHAGMNESYKLQLERDDDLLVLNILNTETKQRTEVRGKPNYEGDGYDSDDKLHQLLDKIGKAANMSELMNGEVVTINPRHPDGPEAKERVKKVVGEAGVGRITKQNATKDAPIGSEFANVKKLGLGNGKPKELHSKARKNSDPNTLFNLGLTEGQLNEKGSIGVPLSSGITVGIAPHRELKIKKSTPGKLSYNENVEVDISGNAEKGYVLSKIVVPKELRGTGVGSEIMQDLINKADMEGAIIALTPDTAFGGSKGRLIQFYKSFGFVPNKGRNKDFRYRETMIRYPKT